ncbi:polygalacturonase-like [Lotus japonicus]|uniref:polygalacturonase-like n=1 Tax=Lotus japonicus TaxID=34305 RepID=UPI002584FAD0|nr:polygalacturonase-like [Lotus japonicus]XP_057442708.1 polygalacturonase-like [Lotus japonicus]
MDMKLNIAIIAFVSFLYGFSTAQSWVLEISKFGGAPNADITQAFTNAWKKACESTTSAKIVIPHGTYKMGAVQVQGPCKAHIEVQVDGTIKAPVNPRNFKGAGTWVQFSYISFFTLSGKGVFDGVGETAWKRNDCSKNKHCTLLPMNFAFNYVNNSIVRDITSKDSKSFNVNVLGCNNFTFDGFKIVAPALSPNTDGIHVGRSTDVKILNTNIGTGDDCVSLGDGIKNVLVQNVNCGPGHGISVGSLGKYPDEKPVEGFYVKNCTLTNTDNGVRIKTWPSTPGTAPITDMHFEDIIMVNVKNPIIIDQEYCPWNQCSKKSPSKIKISKVSFKNIRGTSATPEGVILICSSGVPCDTVELNGVDLTFNGAPATAKCANVKPIVTGKAPTCVAPAA